MGCVLATRRMKKTLSFQRLPTLGFNLRVGMFLCGALALFISIIFTAGQAQGWFEEHSQLRLYAQSGADLKKGMPVRFRAFDIGTVEHFSLQEDGHVEVVLEIKTRYLRFLRTTSSARIARQSVIGNSYIALDTLDTHAPPLRENGYLALAPAADLEQVARELQIKLEPVVDAMNDIAQRLRDPNGDLNQTLRSLQQASAGLVETQDKLNRVLDTSQGLLEQEVKQTLQSSQHTLQTVQQHVPPVLADIQATSTAARQTAEAVKNITEQASPHAAGIAQQTERLLDNSNQTLDAVRGSWPLRHLFPTTPAVVEQDSHD